MRKIPLLALSLCSAVPWVLGAKEIEPFSLTVYGTYASPVLPAALALSDPDGFGGEGLAEWNPIPYASLGLGFEQASFRGAYPFSAPFLGLEGRLFPFENGTAPFSPYLYGGAGLNLSSGAWEGPFQLKAGLGSRVVLVAPVYFDLAVGSHWVQAPGDFQYLDLRCGLGFSFGSREKKEATPSPTPSATAEGTPAPKATSTPEAKAVPTELPAALPTATAVPAGTQPVTIELGEEEPEKITVQTAPVTTLAQVQRYYRAGMDAFLAGNYRLSKKLLLKSISSKEVHGASYYYAETYATLGVIYETHSKEKDHKRKALRYYQRALAIDPQTKSARMHYPKLKAELARKAKKKRK